MAVFNLEPNKNKVDQGEAMLRYSEYPGRVIIMGVNSPGSCAIQAYVLSGRSDDSRNRIFAETRTDGYVSDVRTVAPNMTAEEMAATEDAENIYYKAMDEMDGVYVVTNGPQTPHITNSLVSQVWDRDVDFDLDAAVKAAPVVDGLDLSIYERDRLNTPRIVGAFFNSEGPAPFGLSIVRKGKNPETGKDLPIYTTVQGANLKKVTPGVGFGLQTYNGDRTDPKSYEGRPYPFPLGENTAEIAHRIWGVLNEGTRVAVAVRSIDFDYGGTEYTFKDDSGSRTFPDHSKD